MRNKGKTPGHGAVTKGASPDADSTRILAAIVQSSDAAIIGKTLDGIVTSWNPSAERMFGYTAAEMIGRPISVIATPDRPDEMKQILDRVRRGERIDRQETERRRKDGTRIHISLSVSPIYNEAGEIVGASKIVHDMTEAKRSRSMIEEREARLRSILETAPDAIITIDPLGIIHSFSPAAEKLFGYAAGEVIGLNVKILMHGEHHEKHDGYLARYLGTGEKRIIGIGRQVEACRKDGSIFPMHLAVGEVKIGETHLFSGFITDLTARVAMEQELRQAQKMEAIGHLTGGVAHDFNNLLTVISGNLEMLEGRLKDAEQREILHEAQEATQLGAELSKRLLAFGRRQSLQPKVIELKVLVDGMLDMLRRSLGENVTIETRLTAGLPAIKVDPGQIESALLNLAVNARDAMPNGGKLYIEAGRATLDADSVAAYPGLSPGNYVTLTVTDTGSGMTSDVRQRAFEPFYTTKPVGAGSGLGLSMVYGFVKQSGGHVQLYSEQGVGTTVRIYLPVPNGDLGGVAPPVVVSTAAGTGETILVVEDDPRVRRVSIRRLKELGYTTLEADSGPMALSVLAEKGPIDLLFTDIVMSGGMTGIVLAEEARRRYPILKVLFTSGYAEPAALQDGLLTTGAGWLGKPYRIDELQTKLRALLD